MKFIQELIKRWKQRDDLKIVVNPLGDYAIQKGFLFKKYLCGNYLCYFLGPVKEARIFSCRAAAEDVLYVYLNDLAVKRILSIEKKIKYKFKEM